MRKSSAGALLLASALLGAPAVASAAPSSVHIRDVRPSRFPTISVTVSTATNVSPGTIRISENGSPVRVLSSRTLSQAGKTFDVVLAIDTSDSVAGAPEAAAVQAAIQFVNGLPAGVPVGILEFSDGTTVLQGVSADHALALAALNSITGTRHGTALYDAVAAASAMFTGSSQHNVVLLTDGKDVGSTLDAAGALRAARRAHVGLFTVALGSSADVPVLQNMASRTFGSFFPAAQSDLSAIYAGLAREFSQQYVLTYRTALAAGSQVSLQVAAAGSTDSAAVLLPTKHRGAPSPIPTTAAPSTPLLHGTAGMIVALGLTFLALFVILTMALGISTRVRRERRLARQMGASPARAAEEAAEDEAAASTWIPDPLVHVAERVAGGGFVDRLGRRLEQAEVRLRAGEFLLLSAGGGVVGGVVFGILLGPLFGVLAAIAGLLGPSLALAIRIRNRIKALHASLPDALMMLAGSLRAGHGFLQALDTVAQEVGEPLASELGRVVAEVRLGRRPDEAMEALAERVDSDDFRWAAMAVNIQREVGGNLAEILDTVAHTVRERDDVRRQIDVLSSEGRLSMWILVGLPFLIGLYIAKVNPGYLKLLFTTTLGIVLTTGAAVLMVVGVLWLRKVVRIDV